MHTIKSWAGSLRMWIENIFKKYNSSQINGTAYDPNSIMHYPIDAKLLGDSSFAVGWNSHLSNPDKSFIKEYYPPIKDEFSK